MPIKTDTPLAKITRQTLPVLMKVGLGWDPRITKYISKDADIKKMRADPLFSANAGPVYEIGGFRLQEIGSFGSFDSGVLERIIVVAVPEGESFPDLLGELCEDKTGPLGDKASADLRAQFDRTRFEFGEHLLIGPSPRLTGSKKRRDQLRTINYLARAAAGSDKVLARELAKVLGDNIENLEPPADL